MWLQRPLGDAPHTPEHAGRPPPTPTQSSMLPRPNHMLMLARCRRVPFHMEP